MIVEDLLVVFRMDQRRRIVLEHNMDILEEKGEPIDMDQLLATVQELDSSSATQIMNLVRNQAPLDEIKMQIEGLLERGALERSEQLIEVCNEVQRLYESDDKAQRRENVAENKDYVPISLLPSLSDCICT
ncbi:hypothetical protein N7510_006157 [Penicillium lagena]|uniref:uncharacterized protein n=1 Tax=Penicillium lagena TaxID=94218 RepID=UPI002541B493|nr:uncharacterized protein N7510_006157 [Penicillium lagena]KAJ5612963.1 hypothetical protein N7510_006157 [Penicillium lagena]